MTKKNKPEETNIEEVVTTSPAPVKPEYRIQYYMDAKGEWRWRVIHRNGNMVANCGEGYVNRTDCVQEAINIFGDIISGIEG